MTKLEDIKNGASVTGVIPNHSVEVVSIDWIGDQAITLVYRIPGGSVSETTLYRDDEHRLNLEQRGRAWSFDADGSLLRLVTEANRIKLAHHFDPLSSVYILALSTHSHIKSQPFMERCCRRHTTSLSFWPMTLVLGKTIMAGLLIKELIARSDLERCLIVAPGSIVEQWQDELGEKFLSGIRYSL